MQLIDLTLATPSENLALDEALLERLDRESGWECLRIWEPSRPFVVLGRSSPLAREVNQEVCRQLDIPILRRASGGQTVVAGPGCLMYAVFLDLRLRPELRALDRTHDFVLARMNAALSRFGDCQISGTSDLTIDSKKFSGNSLRSGKQAILYHGTILYRFPIDLIEMCLLRPIRQPAYRGERSHESFLINFPADANSLRQSLVATWEAQALDATLPLNRARELASTKYESPEWTRKIV